MPCTKTAIKYALAFNAGVGFMALFMLNALKKEPRPVDVFLSGLLGRNINP